MAAVVKVKVVMNAVIDVVLPFVDGSGGCR